MSFRELQITLEALSEANRGPHPLPDELLAYHLGELEEQASERIEHHAALCRECARLILDMADFLEEAPAPQEATIDSGHLENPLNVRSPPFYRTLAFARAAAIFFCLLSAALTGYLAKIGGIQPSIEVGSLANPIIVELGTASARGVQALDRVHLTVEVEGVLLIFPVAETQDYARYALRIEDAAGQLVRRRSDLTRGVDGLLTLAVSRDFLPEGRFGMAIYGLDVRGAAELLAEYPIDWQLD